jgi:thiol-disulfide isomerase/thioredoxin
MAPECGGIEICPTEAIYYDKKLKRPVWDESKCTFCLKCTTIDVCPVGCILYARNIEEINKIQKMIKEDPRTQQWLWQERYGVEPGKFGKLAKNINNEVKEILAKSGPKLIDLWHEDYLDCRLHAPLYSNLVENLESVAIYKIDMTNDREVADKLTVTEYPTLLMYFDDKEVGRIEGYIDEENVVSVKRKIAKLLKL